MKFVEISSWMLVWLLSGPCDFLSVNTYTIVLFELFAVTCKQGVLKFLNLLLVYVVTSCHQLKYCCWCQCARICCLHYRRSKFCCVLTHVVLKS